MSPENEFFIFVRLTVSDSQPAMYNMVYDSMDNNQNRNRVQEIVHDHLLLIAYYIAKAKYQEFTSAM